MTNLVTIKNNKDLVNQLIAQGMSEAIILTLPLEVAQELTTQDLTTKKSNVRESIVLDLCNYIDKENKFKFSYSFRI